MICRLDDREGGTMAKRRSIAGAIRAAAHGEEPPADSAATTEAAQPRPVKARTREGKKMIAAPVDPAARQQLKMLSAELDRKAEDLIREALRDLFTKYGKPPIA
jgi:antitoxin-like ribbon-helix-helix protein